MFHTVVLTAGVSILNDKNVVKRVLAIDHCVSNPEIIKIIQESFRNGHIDSAIEERPDEVSAEYSILHSLSSRGRLERNPQVIILHTDTEHGNCAATVIELLIQKKFNAEVTLKKIPNLTIDDSQVFKKSIGLFMNEVGSILEGCEPRSTCFAPIGGFKVMQSFSYMVASTLKHPIYYLHESNQKVLLEIPPCPIYVDETYIQEHIDILRMIRINGAVSSDELKSYVWDRLVQDHSLFEVEGDSLTLNPFGVFLLSRSKYKDDIFETQVCRSKGVMDKFINKDQESFIKDQENTLINKIRSGTPSADLYHEREISTLKNTKELHLYKGSSNGKFVFRAVWKYDSARDTLCINHIWLDHDLYEREIIAGKGLLNDQEVNHEYSCFR